MLKIKKSSLKEIGQFRAAYLESLPEFQELYLEFIVRDSNCYLLASDDKTAGYAIISPENVLIEFYIPDPSVEKHSELFNLITGNFSIRKIYCKSFDHRLIKCCQAKNLKHKLIGYLYRDRIETECRLNTDITARYADESDLQFLSKQNDEVFEPKKLLSTFIKNKGISVFQKDGRIIGCGFLTQVHEKFKYYDIGVWINPESRKKGYATHIITYLKETCIKNNRIPICGCGIDNIASQRTLAKAGFISKHTLIEFDITKQG